MVKEHLIDKPKFITVLTVCVVIENSSKRLRHHEKEPPTDAHFSQPWLSFKKEPSPITGDN